MQGFAVEISPQNLGDSFQEHAPDLIRKVHIDTHSISCSF